MAWQSAAATVMQEHSRLNETTTLALPTPIPPTTTNLTLWGRRVRYLSFVAFLLIAVALFTWRTQAAAPTTNHAGNRVAIGFCNSDGSGFFPVQPPDQLERWRPPRDNGTHLEVSPHPLPLPFSACLPHPSHVAPYKSRQAKHTTNSEAYSAHHAWHAGTALPPFVRQRCTTVRVKIAVR